MNELSGTEWAFWDFRRARHFRRVFFDTLNCKFVTIFIKSTTDAKVWKTLSHRGKILRYISVDLHVKEINTIRSVEVAPYLAEARMERQIRRS
jgi:hypothetical protein